MIDILAIDKALHDCFDTLGTKGARYVVIVQYENAASIGTNCEPQSCAENLLVQAMVVMASRKPDMETVLDGIGPAKGHA